MDHEWADILKELHSLELPWEEVLPQNIIEWLDVFSSSYNVVKEIMFPGILTALSGLMAPKTTIKMSSIEYEPVNLFSIVLAPPGAGKSSALHAAVQAPILALESSEGTPILIEDFSKSGVFLHLKATDGVGVFAKDEVHIFMEDLLSKNRSKELDKDVFIKFFDNQCWTVNKGNTAKRDRIPRTSLAFLGLSQPDSFFKLYGQMAKRGNGLADRILCCCPLPRRLSRPQVNAQVDILQQYPTTAQNLNHIYEYVFHTHQDQRPVTYTLSPEAFAFFVEEEEKLVQAQNAVFTSSNTASQTAANISKAAKLVLRIAAALHVFIDRMEQAIGQGNFRNTPTIIQEREMKRAFALGNWFLDNRYILEKTVQTNAEGGTFSLAKKILWAEGPFITYRMACRLTHAMTATVVEGMKKLEADGLGIVDQDMKCFFKCVPLFIPEEKLQIYGGDVLEYTLAFRKRNTNMTDNQWAVLRQHCPNKDEVSRYFPV